jgi:hypothetical protein
MPTRTVALALAFAVTTLADPVIFDPALYTSWVAVSSDGLSRKALVSIPFTNSSGLPDTVEYTRLDLVGDTFSRGFAQVTIQFKLEKKFLSCNELK